MKRNRTSLRRVTNKAQNNVYDMQVMNDFIDYVNLMVKMLGINKCNVVNMDGTHVNFSTKATCTHDDKGNRTVSSVGAQSSNRATAALAWSLAGDKLVHFLTCKGKRTKRGLISKEL